MKIAIIGTGYVGLASGVCFSDFGRTVVCVDKDSSKVEILKAGKVPIYEPGLDELIVRNVEAGRLSFIGDLGEAVSGADAVVMLTEWDEFRALNRTRLAKTIKTPRMADLRNIYSNREATQAGFEAYVSVGQ